MHYGMIVFATYVTLNTAPADKWSKLRKGLDEVSLNEVVLLLFYQQKNFLRKAYAHSTRYRNPSMTTISFIR